MQQGCTVKMSTTLAKARSFRQSKTIKLLDVSVSPAGFTLSKHEIPAW
jgi:hypothetical protein